MKNCDFYVTKKDRSAHVFFNQIWRLDKMIKIFLNEYAPIALFYVA